MVDMSGFWILIFFFYEGNFRMIGDDLVNFYYLFLCCLDLIFVNVIMCLNRRDLLNLLFKGKMFIFEK